MRGSRPDSGHARLDKWLSIHGEPPVSRERIDIIEELANSPRRDERRKLARALSPGEAPRPAVPPRDL